MIGTITIVILFVLIVSVLCCQKELQMQITKEITIITIIPIANALPVAPHIMMDIARNADIPTSIRAGWERNIN